MFYQSRRHFSKEPVSFDYTKRASKRPYLSQFTDLVPFLQLHHDLCREHVQSRGHPVALLFVCVVGWAHRFQRREALRDARFRLLHDGALDTAWVVSAGDSLLRSLGSLVLTLSSGLSRSLLWKTGMARQDGRQMEKYDKVKQHHLPRTQRAKYREVASCKRNLGSSSCIGMDP